MKKIDDALIVQTLARQIMEGMKTTLKNKKPGRKKAEEWSPMFISLRLKEFHNTVIKVSQGSVFAFKPGNTPERIIGGELRIGDYKLGCSKVCVFLPYPDDHNMDFLKRRIWDFTEMAMYEAFKELNFKVNESIGICSHNLPFTYFSKEKSVQYKGDIAYKSIKCKYWMELLKRVSEEFIQDDVDDSNITMQHLFEKRIYINSEGTIIIDSGETTQIIMSVDMGSDDNILYNNRKVFNVKNCDLLPSEDQLRLYAKTMIEELRAILKSPQQEAGTYPTIVDGENFGVIVHEAIGHSLEAMRSDDEVDEEDSSQSLTFQDKIEQKVAPDFLSIIDDPTLPGSTASYKYDEEGVLAQKVILIKDGILKNYLHSRETAGKMGVRSKKMVKSNGHARSETIKIPTPRMSNIIVESSNQVSMNELKKMLIEECKRQNKPYGLILRGSLGGFVEGQASYFHTFPRDVFRLYPDGREELVHGVYLVSTPYQLLENIVTTSGDYQVFSGYCGAESGNVASTQTAPDAFIKSVEFGRIPRTKENTILPPLSLPPKRE